MYLGSVDCRHITTICTALKGPSILSRRLPNYDCIGKCIGKLNLKSKHLCQVTDFVNPP